MNPVRVRFAPSPTGRLHIGSLRTALYDYLFAKKLGGTFVLRIEDTDQKRSVAGGVEDIVDTLQAYGISPDEGVLRENGQIFERGVFGPYVQSKRLPMYRDAAAKLIEQESAYFCFCTPERLVTLRASQEQQHLPPGYDGTCRTITPTAAATRVAAGESHVIRFRTPREGSTQVDDLVRGLVVFRHATIEDAVLIKTDGFPTYHLANVVDDHAMEISHVLRAEEWLPSLPLHLLLYTAFAWEAPAFAHLPLILNTARKKLSKRDGTTAAADFLADYLPMATLNFIALLGWNPKTEQEYYPSLTELQRDFDLSKVNKAGAIFDTKKLIHLNRLHMRTTDPVVLAQAAKLSCSDAEARKYLPLVIERAERLSDLQTAITFLTEENITYDSAILIPKNGTPERTKEVIKTITLWLHDRAEGDWGNADEIRTATLSWISERGWSNQEVLWPVRVALSGSKTSPDVFDIAIALGKKRALQRLQQSLETL
ncbi:MAG: glutamate--tRNA ligase [Patescibacteria group bacterium]